MTACHLPEEIVHQVCSYLEVTSHDRLDNREETSHDRLNRGTLHSAMPVCRTFEQIVTPLLYALITTTPDVRPVSVIRLLVRTLLARPERASLAQTLVAGPVGPEFAIRPGGDRSDW
ncbi:uncharacterized protein K489DRAFT_399018 [Dissoconium aciculare CBS 342.82]|uniref:F-box domain-containing protein n=1 Tax=Dissoconium aciculare CBS 342.82 TaxID=1314786 RepID=A0A6J3MGH2_9PEZI|nr:uncharacterized protein K489DRAFT_399018 [Dissoconium aciculare CBS 342.82]KAF1826779.1 hypothetical protein K489DRAFT_399018 [Dissoconium aciculare CBS 342.82]